MDNSRMVNVEDESFDVDVLASAMVAMLEKRDEEAVEILQREEARCGNKAFRRTVLAGVIIAGGLARNMAGAVAKRKAGMT